MAYTLKESLDYLQSISKSLEELKVKLDNIKYHDNLYYVQSKPVISDREYDYMVREYNLSLTQLVECTKELIKQVETLDNSTEKSDILLSLDKIFKELENMDLKVGSSLGFSYQKKKHKKPMLSLANTYNVNELIDFLTKVITGIRTSLTYKSDESIKTVNPFKFIVEEKIDGLSCDLRYENGQFVEALTRGDGLTGEVITRKIIPIDNVPKRIKYVGNIHIRGELVIKYEDWYKIEKMNLGYKNPRNTASGIIRSCNSSSLDSFIKFIAYEVVEEDSDIIFDYQHQKREFLESISDDPYVTFELPKSSTIEFNEWDECNIDEYRNKLNKMIEEYEIKNKNTQTDYPTDGLVIKLDDLKYAEILGYTVKYPKFMIAYKFSDNEYVSEVTDIVWQVGRTGKVTPVVEIKPVEIDGSVITRATAHNLEMMVKLGNIQKGKSVIIVKSAMVIPKIIKVVDHPIDSVICTKIDYSQIDYPKVCPSCGTKLLIEGPDLICPNKLGCRDRIIQSLSFFAGRDYMNIVGMSTGIITILFDKGLLNHEPYSFYDLYKYKDELLKLDKFGTKSVNKLLESIERSKQCEPYRLIAALGYPNIGRTICKKLLDEYGDLNKIPRDINVLVSNKNVQKIGIGDVIKANLKVLLDDLDTIIKIYCVEKGINCKSESSEIKDRSLINTTFVFTGKFNVKSRTEYSTMVKLRGANVSSSVNKNTTYLVEGENPTAHKVAKAHQLNKVVIDEQKFIDMFVRKNNN